MEGVSRQIRQKIDAARLLFSKIDAINKQLSQSLISELNAVEIKFVLSTSHLFLQKNRLAASREFMRIVASEDFINHIDGMVKTTEDRLQDYGVRTNEVKKTKKKAVTPTRCPVKKFSANVQAISEIQRLFDIYPVGSQSLIEQSNYNKCLLCDSGMVVNTIKSELKCDECGAIKELVGTVFEDYNNDVGQKVKSGHNPNRHFQYWWTHILAHEPEERLGDKDDPDNTCGEKLLSDMRNIIARDPTKTLQLLNVNDVRSMLRELKKTDMNKSVALILKKLTGVGPPNIPEAMAIRAENLFSKVIEVRKNIATKNKSNRNYYPYYIYKILDQILEDEEHRRILYYIYIQSKETVLADDAEWEDICAELGEIKYVPTDRTMALKYAPSTK